MKTSLGILAACVGWLIVDLSDGQSEYYSRILQETGNLVDDINSGFFTAVMKKMNNTVNPFLTVFPSVVKWIFRNASESQELKEQLCDNINLKVDQVNSQFFEIVKLIDWAAVQIPYTSLETNIRVVSDHFKRIFEVPLSGLNEQKHLFIKSYESGYADSGAKLYEGFIQDNGIISQSLLRPAMKYTENNRRQMRTFMLGILKLLLEAAEVELEYLAIKGFDHIIPTYSLRWQSKFEHVQGIMTTIDLELKDNFLDQARKDIDKFSMNNFWLSNQIFSQNLYLELSTKYFWRDWLVVVSSHTEGGNDAHSQVCTGTIKSTHRTKDLVIDSVEHGKPSFDINDVQKLFASLQQTCQNTLQPNPCRHEYHGPHRRVRRCGGYVSENADVIFSWFNNAVISCTAYTYSSVGIIATSKNPVYYAGPTEGNSGRLFVNDLGPCNYNVHFFG